MVGRWLEAPQTVEAGRSFEHDKGLASLIGCAKGGGDESGPHAFAFEMVGGQCRREPSNNLVLWAERLTGDSGDERRLMFPLASDLKAHLHGMSLGIGHYR